MSSEKAIQDWVNISPALCFNSNLKNDEPGSYNWPPRSEVLDVSKLGLDNGGRAVDHNNENWRQSILRRIVEAIKFLTMSLATSPKRSAESSVLIFIKYIKSFAPLLPSALNMPSIPIG